MPRSANRAVRLGRTQKLVLQLLANGPKAVRVLAFDWPGLTEGQVRGALDRLASRGLVDRVGYRQRAYIYGLTAKGREVEAQVTGLEGDEDA